MATKKIAPKSKQATKKLRGKLWSELKPGTKRKYKAAGVTPAKFNAARSKRGSERAQYLGLRPHQISGASTPSALNQAKALIESVFGSAPRYKPEGVTRFLKGLPPERVRKIARSTKGEVYDWAFNGDDDFSDDHSRGMLFYH